MYRIHRLYRFQCTEHTSRIRFNEQSIPVVYVSKNRVHHLYMFQCSEYTGCTFQCTEYTGCICFNSSSLYYTSKCTLLPPLEPHTKKYKAKQLTTLHQLSVQLPDIWQAVEASTHNENLCLWFLTLGFSSLLPTYYFCKFTIKAMTVAVVVQVTVHVWSVPNVLQLINALDSTAVMSWAC